MSDAFVTPWSIACQAPLSMGFPRQAYWSELPFPSPGDLPDTGIEPRSPGLQVDSLLIERQRKSRAIREVDNCTSFSELSSSFNILTQPSGSNWVSAVSQTTQTRG